MDIPFSDIEWTIENFSCWNYQIHTNKISLLKRQLIATGDCEIFLELFPRGVSCREKHLVLHFCNQWFSGDLEISFIGSNGCVIQTESMIIKDNEYEFYIGPIFEKCVAWIREDEPHYKDSLTLRFHKNRNYLSRRHVRHIIRVFNASIKIHSKIFKECNFRKDAWNFISKMDYPCEDGVSDQLEIHAFKTDCGGSSKVKLKLVPVFLRATRTLAIISTFYQVGKGAFIKYQDSEHMFTEMSEQIGMTSWPFIGDWDLNFYIIMRLKIIRRRPVESHNHTSFYPCEIELDSTNSSKILSTAASHHPHDASVDVLTKELISLYQDRDFCDFQLRCDEVSFPVHKGILSARSPVFKSMLSTNMREAQSGTADIEDLDPGTLDQFLAFLYSGKVDDLHWDSALKLYYAADKYQVATLKGECVFVLYDEASVSNICDILSLADRHQDHKLTSFAKDFLHKNYDRICNTEEWMDFIAVNPSFLSKLSNSSLGKR